MDIIDFHAHVLPRADHGSSSVKDSLSQLLLAKECGVSRIVATPHFYPHRDSVDSFITRRDRCYEALVEALPSDAVMIVPGAEVLICDNIEELPGIERLCPCGSNVILLELPFSDFSRSHYCSVQELIRKGFDVVLAHADRYEKRNIEMLLGAGAKIQLNASSLSGLFVKKHLFDWIKRHKVVALGSDIHGCDNKAYRAFVKAQKKIADELDYIKEASDAIWQKFRI